MLCLSTFNSLHKQEVDLFLYIYNIHNLISLLFWEHSRMPPFNGGQLQQQLRAFLVFIQLQIIMHFLFLRRPQQPPPPAPAPPSPPAPIHRPRSRHNMWVRPWLLQRGGPITTLWLICMPQTFQDSPTT